MATPLQKPVTEPLAALRDRLDAIDGELHRLLAERFRIVAEIGRSKGPDESVMRPAREAEVLHRRLAASDGAVPDETIAHIWRVIIAAACAVQRPYTVHVGDARAGDTVDAARFLYGPVPMQRHASDDEAIAALAERRGDVAVVSSAALAEHGRWRGFAHVIGQAPLSNGNAPVAVLGGTGVETSGRSAFLAQQPEDGAAPPGGDSVRMASVDEIAADAIVLGRFDPFPVVIPVAR